MTDSNDSCPVCGGSYLSSYQVDQRPGGELADIYVHERDGVAITDHCTNILSQS